MNSLFSLLIDACALVVTAAVATIPVVAIVLALDVTIGRRLAARHRCLLWSLVAVRLLVPMAPESPFSAQVAWRLLDSRAASLSAGNANLESSPADSPLTRSIESQSVAVANSVPTGAAVAQNGGFDQTFVIASGISAVWLLGAILVATRAIIASVRFSRRLRKTPFCEDHSMCTILRQTCHQLGINRLPEIRLVSDLPSPALFGVLRPTLCLPDGCRSQFNDRQLRMIMLHELMHIRRRDPQLSWFMLAVQAVHWFNPISWLSTERVATYREQACDEAVRNFTQPAERREYADLLLQFAVERPTTRLGLLGMWFARPGRRIRVRIEPIMAADSVQRRFPAFAALAILAAVAFVSLTDARQPIAHRTSSVMANDETHKSESRYLVTSVETADAFVEERSYDISQALAKLAEINPNVDARQWLMSYTRVPGLNPRAVLENEGAPNHLHITMSPMAHDAFANMLSAIGKSGPWQIAIETRMVRSSSLESVPGIDWRAAVRFAEPSEASYSRLPDITAADHADQASKLSLDVNSVSWDYSPYLAMVVDRNKMRHILEHKKVSRPTSNMSAPKVTLFNGQSATLRDESQLPFVVGVTHSHEGNDVQPEVAVLSEGTTVDFHPVVVRADALELECRLTMAYIDGTREVKLPKQEVVVQAPRISRKSIAARCQLAPGETLLIAQVSGHPKGEHQEYLVCAITANWFMDSFATTREQ